MTQGNDNDDEKKKGKYKKNITCYHCKNRGHLKPQRFKLEADT